MEVNKKIVSNKYKLTKITTEELRRLCNEDADGVVSELYRLAGAFVKKKKPQNLELEDLIQELVIKAWAVIDKFDDKRAYFPTFINMVFTNELKMKYRAQSAKCRAMVKTISLNETIRGSDEAIEIIDTIPYESESKVDIRKYKMFLKSITIEYLEGAKQNELAKKYNISQTQVSRRIKKDLENLKEQITNGKGETN